jgi:hypothetical protein
VRAHRVIARHPKLNIIWAHFFFLSDKLDEAAKLLIEHPSYNIDLAAKGVENSMPTRVLKEMF